jgi:hypothetical protein
MILHVRTSALVCACVCVCVYVCVCGGGGGGGGVVVVVALVMVVVAGSGGWRTATVVGCRPRVVGGGGATQAQTAVTRTLWIELCQSCWEAYVGAFAGQVSITSDTPVVKNSAPRHHVEKCSAVKLIELDLVTRDDPQRAAKELRHLDGSSGRIDPQPGCVPCGYRRT